MIYIVSGGALNSTHSRPPPILDIRHNCGTQT